MRAQKPRQRGSTEHARRGEIVAAAEDHFRRYGYDKTTVGDLAKAVGFSTAYIYKFFDSKQAIGEAICCLCLDRIEANLLAIVESDRPASERLRSMIRTLSLHAREMSAREARLQEMVCAAHREHWQSFEKHDAALRAIITRVVEEGRRSGEFERKTPIDETCRGILLALEPLRNPSLWPRLDDLDSEAVALAALVLRSLAI